MLGTGTSITQSAARRLSDEGVMIGFTGGDGTPLFLASQSEYRPNEYFYAFLKKWQCEEKRLALAINFQLARAEFVLSAWSKMELSSTSLETYTHEFKTNIQSISAKQQIMTTEANYAKKLYALNATRLGIKFTRKPGENNKHDLFNSYLDNGNYLAYGLASLCLWVYGIPYQMAVNHGFTRRGALVFDVADIIKDDVIMPTAMQAAAEGNSQVNMRQKCIENIKDTAALDYLFKTIKACLNV